MKQLITIIFALWSLANGFAQDTVVFLSTSDFESHQQLFLAPLDGWIFQQGNDPNWANEKVDTSDWEKMNPTQLSTALEDRFGRIEGWFRLKFKLDHSFKGLPLGISRHLWAASDVYINGDLIHSFGNTGSTFEGYNPLAKEPISVHLEVDKVYVLAVHVVTYETTFTQREIRLKPENLQNFINLTGPAYSRWVEKDIQRGYTYGGICIGIAALLVFLFWLLVALNRTQKVFRLIACLATLVLIYAVGFFYSYFYELSYSAEKIRFLIVIAVQGFTVLFGLLILEWVLLKRTSWITLAFIFILTITSVVAHLFSISWPFGIAFTMLLGYLVYLLITQRASIKGAELAVVASIVIPTIAMSIYIFVHKYSLDLYEEYDKLIISLTILAAPFMLMIYISMRFKEVLKNMEEEAKKVLQVTEEKKQLLADQNLLLEKQVKERTSALNTSLANLKATQTQLIHSEKMASLGELTAGIAHEIQNPLNFVNNFSEVSNELVDEMNEELGKGDVEEAKAISKDIKQNLEKITHHGKRADAIVKGMLQHSRNTTAEKAPTDINKLTDEYLRLAYHGLRAKDKSFNATLETDFDEQVGLVDVMAQDMGRVILNLITNAFYAINEKKHAINGAQYSPTVSVSTKKQKDSIHISVQDNGNGIPKHAITKIFQPFFTTKPTGQGTGLGLSVSYDIVTKGHGGTLQVETDVGQGTTFIISIPVKPKR